MTLVMAVLAVCPCPAMAAPGAPDPHSCCAGKAGLTVAPDTGSCCADEARDTVAVATAGVTLGDGWPFDPAVIAVAPGLLPPPCTAAALAARAAPPVLRI